MRWSTLVYASSFSLYIGPFAPTLLCLWKEGGHIRFRTDGQGRKRNSAWAKPMGNYARMMQE